MTHNKIDRPNTAIESRSSLNGLIVSSLLALGVASAFTGHSLAATSPETNVARLERAMDKRPTPARSSDGLGLGRNVPQLRLEPIAISERDGAQK